MEVDGEYYELGYTLPGQRTGSCAWFNKLSKVLEEYKLESDAGLPALFFRKPEKGKPGFMVLSHVDDLEVFGSSKEFKELVTFLEGKVES